MPKGHRTAFQTSFHQVRPQSGQPPHAGRGDLPALRLPIEPGESWDLGHDDEGRSVYEARSTLVATGPDDSLLECRHDQQRAVVAHDATRRTRSHDPAALSVFF